MTWNRKAQSTVEYAVLAAVVVGALLVMQIYMKRGFSGKLKEATDRVGEQFTPLSATYKYNKSSGGERSEETFATGKTVSKIVAEETQTRGGATGQEEPVNTALDVETLFKE